jgi:hypothetical protein
MAGAHGADSLGRGRSLAEPAFAADTGTADPHLRLLITSVAAGETPALAAARDLRDVRLLTAVVAVLDAMDEAGGDKDSHMAVVSMVNERGERGLLGFTGVDSLAAWDPQARPVPALGRDVARAAIDDGATAIVIDVSGPQRLVIDGPALTALADNLDLPAVQELLGVALAPLTSDGWAVANTVDARPLDAGVDVIVQLVATTDSHPDGRLLTDVAQQAAGLISARPDIHRLAPGGIGVTSDSGADSAG